MINNITHSDNDVKKADILDVLLKKNLLIKVQVDNIRQESKITGKPLEEILEKNRFVSQEKLLLAYSSYFGLPIVRLKELYIPPETIKKIPEKIAKKYSICIFGAKDNILRVAIAKPQFLQKEKPGVLNDIQKKQDVKVKLYITSQEDFDAALKYYHFKPHKVSVKEKKVVHNLKKKPNEYQKPSVLDILVKQKLINQKKARQILEESLKENKTIEAVIRGNGIVLEDDLVKAEGQFYGLPVAIEDLKISTDVVKQFPENLAKTYRIVFFETISDKIFKAVTSQPDNPAVYEILDFLKKRNKIEVQLYITTPKIINNILKRYKDVPLKRRKPTDSSEVKPEVEKISVAPGELDVGSLITKPIQTIKQLKEIIKSENVPKMVAGILNLASNKKASDIHIEPREKDLRIRYRIDGVLRDIVQINKKFHPPIIARVKISSRMRIDEQRVPQDGRFDVNFKKGTIDIRVSTLPTSQGEKVVMRLLDKTKGIISLEELGLRGRGYDILSKNVKKPYGMILATGPTGSGKTTTLYAILQTINSSEVNIVTLEDPIEYEISGINHCQARSDIGFSFADGLRSVLRQDPNVIMIGEIRDRDTAGMAIHASLTGHLVLSTLHTNDASGAVPRLVDMKIESFLIASSVSCVVAQRLVRRICSKCKQKINLPPQLHSSIVHELKTIPEKAGIKLNLNSLSFYRGKGCADCEGGYIGRLGIFEVLPISSEIQKLIVARSSGDLIKAKAIEEGMLTIRQDGFIKASSGETTIDEVLRVTLTEKNQ